MQTSAPAGLLLVLSLALAACGGDGNGSSQPTATGLGSGSAVETTSPSPTPMAAAVAAVDAAGRAVVLDGRTGEIRQVLLEGIDVSGPSSNAIALTPDGSAVYVVRPGEPDDTSEIVQVSIAGGEPTVVASGRSPAVSPDGSTLAYVRLIRQQPAGFEPTIRLRQLSDSSERELRSQESDFFGIHELAWTRNGRMLAFTAGEIKTGVHVIDSTATSLDDARRLGPENLDASWDDVAALRNGRVAVIERCCTTPDPDPERWQVLSVDVRSGVVDGEVFGRDRTEAARLDARDDADGLLVLERVGPDGGPLLRWDGSSALEQIADGIIAAAW